MAKVKRTREAAVLAYAEEIALFYERGGLPRIAARVLGWLMVCDPPQQTAGDLVDALSVSKASVSNTIRLLTSVRLIERAPGSKSRSVHYRLCEDGFTGLFEQKLATLTAFRPLADRGLELLGEDGPRALRLREMRALNLFWERALPSLTAKWRRERKRLARAGFPVEEVKP